MPQHPQVFRGGHPGQRHPGGSLHPAQLRAQRGGAGGGGTAGGLPPRLLRLLAVAGRAGLLRCPLLPRRLHPQWRAIPGRGGDGQQPGAAGPGGGTRPVARHPRGRPRLPRQWQDSATGTGAEPVHVPGDGVGADRGCHGHGAGGRRPGHPGAPGARPALLQIQPRGREVWNGAGRYRPRQLDRPGGGRRGLHHHSRRGV
mmetsp:Transcript_17409/g.52176  ORF Transcript_17409/g.52176 Transcript_17409/m.52176 type:complete len:200 (-) Transcript_17409:3510-4109(-)